MENNTMAPATPAQMYDNAIATFQGGSAILLQTQGTASKAMARGNQILQMIADNGGKLSPETDKLCNDYIALCNTRLKEMQEARKPITQVMDKVKELFIQEEKKIDGKVAGTAVAQLQVYRNNYARELAEEEQRQRREAERKAAKEKDRVNLTAECERRLYQYFSHYLMSEKQRLQALFNGMTLDSFDGTRATIMAYEPAYPYQHYSGFKHQLTSAYHDQDEIGNIAANILPTKFDDYSSQFRKELGEIKQGLIDRFQSKKEELDRMAAADAAERERLEADKLRREKEDQERIEREAAQKKAQEEQAISQKQIEGETMALFNQDADITASAAMPETRQGYEIEVLHQAGWVQIIQLWYDLEGKTLALDSFPKKTLAQMRTACEKHAHKTGTKIESQFLVYKETYKAVNRKD